MYSLGSGALLGLAAFRTPRRISNSLLEIRLYVLVQTGWSWVAPVIGTWPCGNVPNFSLILNLDRIILSREAWYFPDLAGFLLGTEHKRGSLSASWKAGTCAFILSREVWCDSFQISPDFYWGQSKSAVFSLPAGGLALRFCSVPRSPQKCNPFGLHFSRTSPLGRIPVRLTWSGRKSILLRAGGSSRN